MANIQRFSIERLINEKKSQINNKISKKQVTAAIFLSSEAASYITGETMHVNGGMYMSWQNLVIIY